MRFWQYYVGVRLAIYDLLLALFLAGFLFRALLRRRTPLPHPALRAPLTLLWAVLALSALSFFAIDFSLPPASGQFWKGLASQFLTTCGLTVLVAYLDADSSSAVAGRILRTYILGVVAASVYSFVEVLSASQGFDLGKAIFTRLSHYGPDFDLNAPFYYEWDVFFRAAGFTGVNSQATYTASAIPLLLLAPPFQRRPVNLAFAAICLAGTALTFSRNGFLTIVITFLAYILLRPSDAGRFLLRITIISLPLIALLYFFSSGASSMISTRIYHSIQDVGSGRREIYEATWPTVATHPFGHGLNQYSVVTLLTSEVDFSELEVMYYKWPEERVRRSYANLHNNWMTWLFEGGWPLLLAQLGYHGSLLIVCLRSRTKLGLAAFCSMSGLMLSGFFNMTLDLFSTQLLFVLLPVCALQNPAVRHFRPTPELAMLPTKTVEC